MPHHTLFIRSALKSAALSAVLLMAGAAQAQTAAGADAQLARNLAATCATCHGANGHALGDMKPIAGMPAEKLLAMLDDYRNGNLPATIMHQISKGYTPDQLKLIAGYFAAQQPSKK
jgi:cytochrome c553